MYASSLIRLSASALESVFTQLVWIKFLLNVCIFCIDALFVYQATHLAIFFPTFFSHPEYTRGARAPSSGPPQHGSFCSLKCKYIRTLSCGAFCFCGSTRPVDTPTPRDMYENSFVDYINIISVHLITWIFLMTHPALLLGLSN